MSPHAKRFRKQPANTLYSCKECRLPIKKGDVLSPPLIKGSNLVICKPCGNRPVCSTCLSPGTMDRKAPELQLDHEMFMETKLLVNAEIGEGSRKEKGIICRDCLHEQQKIGFDVVEVG